MAAPPLTWARALDRWTLRLARVGGRILGRPSEATLQRLARQDRPSPPIEIPDFGPDHLAEGRDAFAAGRHADALFHFSERAREAPQDPWGWHGRGDALQLLGEPAGALEAYDRAAALSPGEGLHHGGRANALEALGREAEAQAAWQRALGLDPTLGWMRPRAPPVAGPAKAG